MEDLVVLNSHIVVVYRRHGGWVMELVSWCNGSSPELDKDRMTPVAGRSLEFVRC